MFREGLGEGYDGDIAFASALETFGGGHNDPIGVAFGGGYSMLYHSFLDGDRNAAAFSMCFL